MSVVIRKEIKIEKKFLEIMYGTEIIGTKISLKIIKLIKKSGLI